MRIYDTQNGHGDWYDTFCVEHGIYFHDWGIYTVDSIGDRAFGGGPDYHESPDLEGDPISDEAKWLYAAFHEGLFTDVGLIQNAIWYAEDESNNLSASVYTDLFGGRTTADLVSEVAYWGWDIRVVTLNTMVPTDRVSLLVSNLFLNRQP